MSEPLSTSESIVTNSSGSTLNIPAFNLENILGENHDAVEHPGTNGAPATGWDEETPEVAAVEGFCVECEGESRVSAPLLTPFTNADAIGRSACTGVVRNVFRHIL
jgi:hypothetical protein